MSQPRKPRSRHTFPRSSWQRIQADSGFEPLQFAVVVYKARNLTKADREAIPPQRRPFQPFGYYTGKQAGGPWFPHPYEVRACCQAMTPLVLGHPYHYQRHCRTLRHIALLFNVDEPDLRKALDLEHEPLRCATCSKFRSSDDYICKSCRKALT